MRNYETTFIINGTLNDQEREAIIERYEKALVKYGAEMERTLRWGMRKLAYPISKCSHGYYVIYYFTADPSVLSKIHHDFDLNDKVLRYMSLYFDGKYPSYIRDEGLVSAASEAVTEENEEIASVSDESSTDDQPEVETAEETTETETAATDDDTDEDTPSVEEASTDKEVE